jgi:hypothetical protein
MCVIILLYVCPYWYYYNCVFILLHMCPHTAMCVIILLYVCPYTAQNRRHALIAPQ